MFHEILIRVTDLQKLRLGIHDLRSRRLRLEQFH
jgi:hypothetical protein